MRLPRYRAPPSPLLCARGTRKAGSSLEALIRRGSARSEKASDSTMQTQDIMEDSLVHDAHLVRLQTAEDDTLCYLSRAAQDFGPSNSLLARQAVVSYAPFCDQSYRVLVNPKWRGKMQWTL